MRFIIYILLFVFCSSCVIHNKFPFVCFSSGCTNISIKPLKKRIQVAINSKKRKIKASSKGSKKYVKKSFNSKEYKIEVYEDVKKDSTTNANSLTYIDFSLVDTIIRVYYKGLNDSLLDNYKKVIQSFVLRREKNKAIEIFLTDYFFDTDSVGKSVKTEIKNHLFAIGIAKSKVFGYGIKHRKQKKRDKVIFELPYLEIRFH